MPKIVAYFERESYDPETGEPGILRREWRVVPSNVYAAEQLRTLMARHSGRDVWPTNVMEARYIRRGAAEPWVPQYGATSMRDALENLESGVVPVHPLLTEIRIARAAARAAEDRKAREAEAKAAAERERAELRRASTDAFRRLAESRDGTLAAEWNFSCSKLNATPPDAAWRSDATLRDHNAAIWSAVTVPAKRKAIRAALAYVRATYGETIRA
jgi:hypothetical protein